MLFNSLTFLVFLVVVFSVYWSIPERNIRAQNLFVLVCSYVFYGWWDWRFLSLIIVSSIVDYKVGLLLKTESRRSRRRALLIASLTANLGLLATFKYFNFFIDSFSSALVTLGFHADLPSLQIVLPVGISFYTFQTMSYSIDIYREQMEPTRDVVSFFAFVSFFPQLVAGPIERARNLLPQFLHRRTFSPDQARDGLRQILWGFFKKVVVADNLSSSVTIVFNSPQSHSGIELALAVFLFAFQIYCDFSGYSDIAIGTARLFGFSLMRNFAFPYFSRDIAEFWRRWHISLSTWFRDYVYIPLGGSRVRLRRRLMNILATFTLSGFWHGANWTFIVWGLLNGIYYIPLMVAGRHHRNHGTIAESSRWPSLAELGGMSLTFSLTLVAWVFFRAASLKDALAFLSRMFTTSWLSRPSDRLLLGVAFVVPLVVVEWIQRKKEHGLAIETLPVGVRWFAYSLVLMVILYLGSFNRQAFIYFQF